MVMCMIRPQFLLSVVLGSNFNIEIFLYNLNHDCKVSPLREVDYNNPWVGASYIRQNTHAGCITIYNILCRYFCACWIYCVCLSTDISPFSSDKTIQMTIMCFVPRQHDESKVWQIFWTSVSWCNLVVDGNGESEIVSVILCFW